METFLVVTEQGTYRIEATEHEVGNLTALLEDYVSKGVAVGPEPLRLMTRQQVLAQLGRSTWPDENDHPFPEPAVVAGDEESGAFTRAWFPGQVDRYQNLRMAARLAAGDTSGPSVPVEPASTQGVADQNQTAVAPRWQKGTRQWEAAGAADELIALVTSRGVAVPSGWVISGQHVSPDGVLRFINWHWPKRPVDLPQVWFTAEAMDSMGMAVEDADPKTVAEVVAATFGCHVSRHQSGFFTCRWGGDDKDDGGRSAKLVFVPWLAFDPASARPNDLGVAGIIDTDTILPDDEEEAVPILAERIGWLATLGEGVVPASRWSTPGATFADLKRKASNVKSIKACPLPVDVAATRSQQLDPDLHTSKRPHHKSRDDYLKIETDQRAAYLASAGQLQFGYGDPIRVEHPDPAQLEVKERPFGLWQVTTPAGKELGVHKQLPMPLGHMDFEESRTFWTTTRGVEQLMAPVSNGGAGLSAVELNITAAWLWPYRHQLLRGWATEIKKRLQLAAEEGRRDREDMLKAMYKAYLGRMASDKWSGPLRQHQQPAMAAAIRADTRFRAMAFAVGVAEAHNVYPVAADVDAWMYWVPLDKDLGAFQDDSDNFGKYRIKAIEYPDGTVTIP